MTPSLDIVTNFVTLLEHQQNHHAALDILDDNFQFKTPNTSGFVAGKDNWYEDFSTSKIKPTFDAPVVSSGDDGQEVVTRKGKVKKGRMLLLQK